MRPIPVSLLLAALVCFCGLAGAEIVVQIEAKINGEIIFARELDAAMMTKWMLKSRRPIETITEEEYNLLRFEVFRERSREILLSQECKSILEKRGYDKRLTERKINQLAEQNMARFRARFDSQEAIQEYMERSGMTEESLRAQCLQLARQQYWENVALQLVPDRVSPVTEAEIEEFKAAHPDDWKEYEHIRLSHILLRVPEGIPAEEEEKIKEKAETIALRAQAGEDFAALARDLSEHEGTREKGGDFGVLRRGQTLPEFDRFFDLPVGKPSNPIRTKLGYQIVLIHSRDTLSDHLYNLKIQQALDDWIEEIINRPETEILCKSEYLRNSLSDSPRNVDHP